MDMYRVVYRGAGVGRVACLHWRCIMFSYCLNTGFVTKRDLTIQNIVGILTEEPYHWISVAKLLKIPDDCIGEASLLESKEKSLKVITEWWVTNTANADWSRISQILKGIARNCSIEFVGAEIVASGASPVKPILYFYAVSICAWAFKFHHDDGLCSLEESKRVC